MVNALKLLHVGFGGDGIATTRSINGPEDQVSHAADGGDHNDDPLTAISPLDDLCALSKPGCVTH
jgi:hypothetical protein